MRPTRPYKADRAGDPTALPAAGVVMESVVAAVLATEVLEKFSSDNLEELKGRGSRHRNLSRTFRSKEKGQGGKAVYIAGLGLIGASLAHQAQASSS